MANKGSDFAELDRLRARHKEEQDRLHGGQGPSSVTPPARAHLPQNRKSRVVYFPLLLEDVLTFS